MFESEVARMPSFALSFHPASEFDHDRKMRTAQVVFPVPGGPCTKVTQLFAAPYRAFCWLLFMPSSTCGSGSNPRTLASTFASPGFLARSTSITCWLGRCVPGRPFPPFFLLFASSNSGAAAKWIAANARENWILFASLSHRKRRPRIDSSFLASSGTIGLTISGFETMTSHSTSGAGWSGSQPAPLTCKASDAAPPPASAPPSLPPSGIGGKPFEDADFERPLPKSLPPLAPRGLRPPPPPPCSCCCCWRTAFAICGGRGLRPTVSPASTPRRSASTLYRPPSHMIVPGFLPSDSVTPWTHFPDSTSQLKSRSRILLMVSSASPRNSKTACRPFSTK
mmetsp:Transcript_55037/g.159362  ORF Transcript_55037/g.159362 Transcript_55037/m.159362 type:complete len:338 (-) Transcript_55037:696-1709(-)